MAIPRHGTELRGCIGGRFVERGGRTVLLDDAGNSYSLEYCTLLMGGWGDASEGVSKLPRVEVVNSAGKVVVPGDRVIIFHARGNPRRPVVLGGVRPLTANDFLTRLHTESGADQNALRVRLLARTSAGAEGGRVDVEAGDGAGGGVTLKATERMEVRVSADPDALTAVQLLLEDGKAEVRSTGVAVPALKGATFLSALQTWDTAMTAFLTALSVDATNPAIQTAATAMLTAHATFAAAVTSSVTAQGAPLLSATLETD